MQHATMRTRQRVHSTTTTRRRLLHWRSALSDGAAGHRNSAARAHDSHKTRRHQMHMSIRIFIRIDACSLVVLVLVATCRATVLQRLRRARALQRCASRRSRWERLVALPVPVLCRICYGAFVVAAGGGE